MTLPKKKILSIFVGVITVLAGIVSVLTYLRIEPFNDKEITSESVVYKLLSLTNKSDSLYVLYNGKSIDNLWKIRFSARNSGKKSIIGIGESSDIYNNCMKIDLEDGYDIISYNVLNDDFSDSLLCINNTFSCYFRKWKIEEKLQIDIWVQSNSAKNPPRLTLDERSIINPVIETKNKLITELETSENSLDWLVNLKLRYPKIFFKIAKYVGLILGALGIFMALFTFYQIPSEYFLLRNWKKRNYKTFLKELDKLEIDPGLKDRFKQRPYDVPVALRSYFSSLPPQTNGLGIALIVAVMFWIVGLGSIVFLLFAWYNL